MEKKKITIGIFALAAVALLSIGMVSAFGFGNGLMNQNLTEEEKAEMNSQRIEMREAMANEDYSTWKSLMEKRLEQMKNQITEENFNQMMEKHQEIESLRASGEFLGNGAMKCNGNGVMNNNRNIMRSGECQRLSE